MLFKGEKMLYKTFIELTCEGTDREDASNIAGDYLCGKIDTGVYMKSKTVSVRTHKTLRAGVSGFMALVVFSLIFLNPVRFIPNTSGKKVNMLAPETCTVMPALKTQNQIEFKKDWQSKKEEAILEYIKN